MTLLNLRAARSAFETAPSVIAKVHADGEFSITAATMANQNVPEKAVYEALADALGPETVIFRFRPRPDGGTTPLSGSLAVFASSLNGDAEPKVYTPNLEPINATFLTSKIGPGGSSVVQIGKVQVEVEIATAYELLDEVRAADDGKEPVFESVKGAPPLTLNGVPTLRVIPQREIPPHSRDVPLMADLEVIEILSPTRAYDEPRLKVRTSDGTVINGLIATSPIRSAIGTRGDNGFTIDETAIGEKFQILEVIEIKDKKGNPVPVGGDGPNKDQSQKTVVIRRTTDGVADLDLSA